MLAGIGGWLWPILFGTAKQAAIYGAVFAVICLCFPCNPGVVWWRRRDIVLDWIWYFCFPLIGRLASLLLLSAGITGLVGLGVAQESFEIGKFGPLAGLPFWGQVVAYLLGADLLLYWTHRAFHAASLWRYHAVHHSPEELDWISAHRFHPLDVLLHSALPDVILLLLGVPVEVIVLVAPFQAFHGALIHANLRWDFGWLKYLLVSPVYHRWHHTDVDRGGSKNFAATFPVFDLAFGTYYMPKGVLPDGYGVDDPDFPKGFWGQLAYPWRAVKHPEGDGVGQGVEGRLTS